MECRQVVIGQSLTGSSAEAQLLRTFVRPTTKNPGLDGLMRRPGSGSLQRHATGSGRNQEWDEGRRSLARPRGGVGRARVLELGPHHQGVRT
jgi:hypothetical protein